MNASYISYNSLPMAEFLCCALGGAAIAMTAGEILMAYRRANILPMYLNLKLKTPINESTYREHNMNLKIKKDVGTTRTGSWYTIEGTDEAVIRSAQTHAAINNDCETATVNGELNTDNSCGK